MWRKSSEPSPFSQPVDMTSDGEAHTTYEDGGRGRGEQYMAVPSRPDMNTQPSQEKLIPAFAPTIMPFRQRSIIRDWWLEIGACMVAIGAVVGIFATLYPYAGRTLPDWPYGLTINSLISIYIVILKAVTLVVVMQGLGQLKWHWFRRTRPLEDVEIFDEASRGSVKGALGLLWRLRLMHFIPTVGAIIIILALASDPIAQQLVQYKQCPYTLANDQATIPRTNAYANGGGPTERISNIITTVPSQMQSAIDAGVFNPSAMEIPFTCPTGNCTIPDTYSSIAYCSKCEDVTHEATANETGDPTVTLPSGLQAEAGALSFVMGPGNGSDLGVYELISTNYGHQLHCNDPNQWPCRNYSAARCSLYPCTRTYTADIHEGKIREKEISQAAEFGGETKNLYISSLDMSCVTDDQKSFLRSHGYIFNETTKWLGYNVSYDPVNDAFDGSTGWASADSRINSTDPILQTIPPKCIYQEFIVSDVSFSGYLGAFFSGNVSVGAGAQTGTSGVVEQIYAWGNITFESVTGVFANVSRSMTAVMRTNGVVGRSEPAQGLVFKTETCVRVVWPWVAFPAALVGLTLVFFTGMVVQTRPRDETSAHDYKASALALLFHGLEERTVEKGLGGGVGSGDRSTLEKQARGIYVRLGSSDRGWRFVESRGPEGS